MDEDRREDWPEEQRKYPGGTSRYPSAVGYDLIGRGCFSFWLFIFSSKSRESNLKIWKSQVERSIIFGPLLVLIELGAMVIGAILFPVLLSLFIEYGLKEVGVRLSWFQPESFLRHTFPQLFGH